MSRIKEKENRCETLSSKVITIAFIFVMVPAIIVASSAEFPQDIQFIGTVTDIHQQIGFGYWNVTFDKVISGPQPCKDEIIVKYITVPPWGFIDHTITIGDKVEVYGSYNLSDHECDVSLNGKTDYYIKKILFFDTHASANPYPSISGTHNGTITLLQNLTVSKLYTYPCPGTGGHTEYIKLWNNTDWNVTAKWNGYQGDWHNITVNNSFTLSANETYNYTIRTGSYPQIIHEQEFNATGGTITCTSFEDANGDVHIDWIPAIKLI